VTESESAWDILKWQAKAVMKVTATWKAVSREIKKHLNLFRLEGEHVREYQSDQAPPE
jgi:hypothetical protein